jgi:hypothetical protein
MSGAFIPDRHALKMRECIVLFELCGAEAGIAESDGDMRSSIIAHRSEASIHHTASVDSVRSAHL